MSKQTAKGAWEHERDALKDDKRTFVTPTTTLAGSHFDTAPLITCGKCRQPRERSGGVFRGVRFTCRACFIGRVFRAVQLGPDGSMSARASRRKI